MAAAFALLAAVPAVAAPGRSETFADGLRSAFAGLWQRLAAAPTALGGLWEEIGMGIDPGGAAAPAPEGFAGRWEEIGSGIDPGGAAAPASHATGTKGEPAGI